MVLVDTNVVVALWVQSDRTDYARRLLDRDPDWRTEAFALIEFANVMSTYVRNGLAAESQALLRLDEAERFLGPGLVLASHRSSLSAHRAIANHRKVKRLLQLWEAHTRRLIELSAPGRR